MMIYNELLLFCCLTDINIVLGNLYIGPNLEKRHSFRNVSVWQEMQRPSVYNLTSLDDVRLTWYYFALYFLLTRNDIILTTLLT